jgi:hypothetical protein
MVLRVSKEWHSTLRLSSRVSWLVLVILALAAVVACGGGSGGTIGGGGGTGSNGDSGGGGGGGAGNSQITVQRVEPSRVMVGVLQGSAILEGTNFTAHSSVLFDGAAVPTSFRSATLEFQLPDSSWNVPRSHIVQVTDPVFGKSNSATYEVYAPRPGPRPFFGQLTQYMTENLLANSLVPDLNGDGKADLVVLGPQDPDTLLYVPQLRLGQSDGTFSAPVSLGSFSLSISPTMVVAGDFNQDGFTDLILVGALVNSSNYSYQVLLNDGSGHFATAGSGPFLPTNGPPPILVGDYNHDGKPDLAVGASNSGAFSFFYGQGSGTFGASLSVGSSLGGVVVFANSADLNGDGYPDFVYLEEFSNGSNQIRMLMSTSGGTYKDSQVAGLPSPTLGFVVGDFNSDHIPDIFAINPNGLGSTYTGAGDGTFTATGNPILSTEGFFGPTLFVTGDFDNDGNLDIATRTASFGPDEVNFLWSDGTGNFKRQAIVSDHSFTLQVGDVNGDGIPDIFEGADPGFGYPSVTLGQKVRSFPSAQIIIPRTRSYLSAGDAFGDGFSDLLVGGIDNGGTPGLAGAIYRSQLNGDFTIRANSPGYATVLVDLNGDGISDMVGFSGSDILIWQGDGSGNFQLLSQMPLPDGFAQFFFRDMDGDGHIDIVLPGLILYGSGNFQFEAVSMLFYQNFIIGDFDGDGVSDIATSSGILFGLGNRSFTAPMGSSPLQTSVGPFPTQAVADIDGDGKDDLVLGLDIFVSTGRRGFVLDQALIVNGYAVSISSVSIADFNGDGLPDIAVGIIGGNDLVLFTNDGSGKYEVTTYAIGVYSVDSVVGDFNHDSKPDIAFLGYGGNPTSVTVLLHK